MQERNNRNERKDNVLTKSEAGDEKTKEDISEESPVNTTEKKEDVLTNQETSHEKMDENIPKESSVNMNRSMDNMASGARKINETGSELVTISSKLKNAIDGIGEQINQFQV